MAAQQNVKFESTRIPIDSSIELRFDHLSGFEQHYAANISMGGMFIRTGDLHPPGTQFDFRFELEDGQPLIQGTAEVLWRRAEDRGKTRPSGIGARFLSLDLESKYVIYRMVDRHIQLGGTPFDLEAFEKSGQQTRGKKPRPFAVALGTGLAALLLLAAGGLMHVLLSRAPVQATDPLEEANRSIDSPTSSADEISTPASPETLPNAETKPARDVNSAGPDDATEALELAVTDWAQAWARKDVEAYLASYSPEFRPLPGMSHAAWEAERRSRLTRPGPIEVEISNLEIEKVAGDRAWARFDQTYASATYRDRVRKTLELVRQMGGWKIVREEVVTDDPAA